LSTVEGAKAWFVGALHISVIFTSARVAVFIEVCTQRVCFSSMHAFAGFRGLLDVAVDASVRGTFVGRFPHFTPLAYSTERTAARGADSCGRLRNGRLSSGSFTLSGDHIPTFDLSVNFAFASAASDSVFVVEFGVDFVFGSVVIALCFGLALS